MKELIITLLLVLLPAYAGPTGAIRHDRADEVYRTLAQEPQFASVASVEAEGQLVGSSVLIAPSWLITARHVLAPGLRRDRPAYADSMLFVHLAGRRHAVERVVLHHEDDLALLRLKDPVRDVVPAVRYRGSEELGRVGVSVGYGITGRGDEQIGAIEERWKETVGVKRAGMNILDDIEEESVLQADFDRPGHQEYSSLGTAEPLDLEYLPMAGDSGGGLFVEMDGKWVLMGVTISGKTGPNPAGVSSPWDALAYGWIGQWHRLSVFNGWIDKHVHPGTR